MNNPYTETMELLQQASRKMEESRDMLLVAMIGDVIDALAGRINRDQGGSD